MDGAQFHLMVNHFPIIGVIIGFLILVAGYIFKTEPFKITALGVFIFSALAGILAMLSGEAAEEVVESLSGFSARRIENHEVLASTFFWILEGLGVVSLITLIGNLMKAKFSKYLYFLVLVLTIVSGIAAFNVGKSGGEIRHSEIRSYDHVIDLSRGNQDF